MGKLIVFEGIDGSGKSTQFKRLCDRLKSDGQDFTHISFPQYDEPSSALIKMYLGGQFGADPNAVNAYAASSFYAVDRFASFQRVWREYYESGGLILTDRYTTSNAVHQGAKIPPDARKAFFTWLYDYEFSLMGLPKPDLVIYMDIEAKDSVRRLERRQSETGVGADIHEKVEFLEKSAACAKEAASFYGWRQIRCFDGERERSEDEIEHEIYNLVNKLRDE